MTDIFLAVGLGLVAFSAPITAAIIRRKPANGSVNRETCDARFFGLKDAIDGLTTNISDLQVDIKDLLRRK